MKVEILGVKIDNVSRREALMTVADILKAPVNGHGRRLYTPNPEMLVLAQKDRHFRETLNSADLAIPDGAGLLWAARRLGTPLKERVTGTDLMRDICELAAERGNSVMLLGGKPGVAAAAAEELRRRFPGLRLAGAASGGRVKMDIQGLPLPDWELVQAVRRASPDILFVAFGQKTQEEWIRIHLPELPTVRLAMGVGGAFDFLSGRRRRAPVWVQNIGLEWLWRFIRESFRPNWLSRPLGGGHPAAAQIPAGGQSFIRIWNAVIVFPFLVISRKR